MRFCSCGKRCRLFVSHMNPLDLFLAAYRVGDSVERVSTEAVDSLYASSRENFDDQFRYFLPRHRAAAFRFVSLTFRNRHRLVRNNSIKTDSIAPAQLHFRHSSTRVPREYSCNSTISPHYQRRAWVEIHGGIVGACQPAISIASPGNRTHYRHN
jgi:hypothetical protein